MFNEINLNKVMAGIIGGFIMPILQYLYGKGNIVETTMVALTFFLVMDWMSGISASRKDNSYGSRYGVDGVFRSFFMLLLPAGGHFLDVMLNLPGFLFGAFAIGLIYHTLQSMTANCVRAGWADWLPISILELVTNWVKSEIESKVSRAQKRVNQRS